MPSRRDALIGAAVAAAGALSRRADAHVSPAPPLTPVSVEVPAGACDCHTHVFGDPARFPLTPTRTYTPGPAPVEDLRALHRALHIDRVVIVQPSVYGADNACTLDAIRQLGSRARGVAVIDEKTSGAALDEMHRAGVRGLRLNLLTAGQNDPAVARQRFRAAVAQINGRPWHIQIYTALAIIDAIGDLVMAGDVAVVFDHFGAAQAALGITQPSFDALLKLVRAGKAYVKISAPYRSSSRAPDYPDIAPLARALIDANPQRVLWGTDWPHPDATPVAGLPAVAQAKAGRGSTDPAPSLQRVAGRRSTDPAPFLQRVAGRRSTDPAPFLQIDDGRVLNQLAVWVPDAARRRTVLVENPARLYGF